MCPSLRRRTSKRCGRAGSATTPHLTIPNHLKINSVESPKQERSCSTGIMSSLDLLDADPGGIASNPAVFGSIAMNGDEYVRCNRCGYGGCDVRVSGCGCTLHAVGFN
jgi:hypothetical protein